MSGFFNELKRRNVFRVAGAYAVASWLLTEVASVVLPTFSAPEWVLKVLIALLLLGFPLAVVFSWVYEMTPEGIRREVDVDPASSITPHTGRRLEILTIIMVVVAILFVIAERSLWKPASMPAELPQIVHSKSSPIEEPAVPAADSGQPEDSRQSVAVLPFVNMSDDPENEYFSDGISEELLNVLVKVDELRVPSRTSSFTFKGSEMRLSEIARELKVDHVLEGSVRKAGNQVRITAQLIDAETDAHLWSETYTRTLDDIFAIQDEIAQAIVSSLKVTLGGETLASIETENSEAYNHYLRGRFHWHKRSDAGFAAAQRELMAAVELDPDYADAWAALADVYVLLPEYQVMSLEEAIPKARDALRMALTLDAESARALTARGYLRFMFEFDHAGAESDFLDAIRIDPGYATAHQWYGEFLTVMRRYEEAQARIHEAAELDPLSPVIQMVLGHAYRFQGRLDEADRFYQKCLELSPEWPNVLGNLIQLRIQQQRYDEALAYIARLERADVVEPGTYDAVRAVIDALVGRVDRDEAIKLAEGYDCTAYLAPNYLMFLGAEEEALDRMEECQERGDPYLVQINMFSHFDPLRDEPRFQQMLRRVGTPIEDDH